MNSSPGQLPPCLPSCGRRGLLSALPRQVFPTKGFHQAPSAQLISSLRLTASQISGLNTVPLPTLIIASNCSVCLSPQDCELHKGREHYLSLTTESPESGQTPTQNNMQMHEWMNEHISCNICPKPLFRFQGEAEYNPYLPPRHSESHSTYKSGALPSPGLEAPPSSHHITRAVVSSPHPSES